jgi:ABC-type Na+ efflux pump permease subunit
MKKIYRISLWEFKRYALTKGWLFSLIVIPAILFVLFHLQIFIKETQGGAVQYLIGVLDTSPGNKMQFGRPNIAEDKSQIIFIDLITGKRTPQQSREMGLAMMREHRLDGMLMISDDAEHPLQYYSESFPDDRFYSLLQSELVKAQVFDRSVSGADSLKELVIMPEIKILRFDTHAQPFLFDPEGALRNITNYSLLFFLALSFIAGTVIRSFQEEKSNRLIEVLLSSASILELTMGKFIAFSVLALSQMSVWTLATWGLGKYFDLPDVSPRELFLVLSCFAVGLLFFVSLYLYIGSRILKESSTQFVLTFLSLVIFFPMLFSQRLIFTGDVGLITTLGFLPIFTPSTSLLQIASKSYNSFYLIQQNLLTLLWCVILLLPLIKTTYNPFGMFGTSSKRPENKKEA